MKKYTTPNVKIVNFVVEDIITQSGLVVNSSDLTGSDLEMYQIYQQNSTAQNTNVSVFTW